uniref:TBC1 domain family member 15 n=1 Tax=Phlebotomus papatasi TaxID=29031 RepID=A0A1B0DJW6_PHLPP
MEIQEICTHDGVLLKKANSNCLVELNTTGSIHLIHSLSTNELWIEWRPNDGFLISDTDTQEQDEWSFVDTIVRRNRTTSESLIFNTNTNNITVKDTQAQTPPKQRNIRVRLRDLKSVEVLKNGLVIKLIGRVDGRLHSEYVFQHGNADNFVRSLSSTHCLQRNHRNRNVYDVVEDHNRPQDRDKLQKTFAELQIDDIKSGSGWISNMMRRPYEQTLDIFAKIADVYVATPLSPPTSSPDNPRSSPGHNASPSNAMMQSTTEDYEVLSTSPRLMGPDPESAAVANLARHAESPDTQRLPQIEVQPRGQPLSEMVWRSMINEDGSIPSEKVDLIKEKIFRGGIEEGIRAELWKFLLDYDMWASTEKQREHLRAQKRIEYYTMKSQWLRMTSVQESNFSNFRDRKCQIEKDVKRTDRTHEFFAGDDNPNLETLHELLMTYVMYNFDLGYVQGMSDLLAPILYVMQNEKDAFWCFVGFMDRVFSNFDMDQAGMKRQLHDLNRLLAFANPKLHSYFLETGSDNMYFCFRWLLVWFKREFSQDDIMRLWEVLWTGLPCINYHLFVSLAILDEETETIIGNKYEFNEILKHVNELSMRIDLDRVLAKAEAIYHQVKNAPHLTDEIRGIIGEEPMEKVQDVHTDSDDESDAVISGPTKSVEEEEKLQKKIEEALEQSMYFNFY